MMNKVIDRKRIEERRCCRVYLDQIIGIFYR